MSTSRLRRAGIALALSAALAVGITAPATFVAPLAAHAADSTFTLLTEGARGEKVRALQLLLNANGAGLSVDGIFGGGTKKAVENYQRAKGLRIDGQAGPVTLGSLTASPNLQKGSSGLRVQAAQRLLNANGAGLSVDGQFGDNTRRAVINFQNAKRLQGDGIIGPKTWSALFGGATTTPPTQTPSHNIYTRIDPRNGCYDQSVRVGKISARQRENARTIIAVGKAHGFSQQGQVVAIAAALQESKLCNINFGDRDSVGLFQQRPRYSWGTVAQITNTVLASRAFYGVATHTNNPGLRDIPGWENMSVTRAAQAVQRSGFPNAYAQWEDEARWIVRNNQDVAPVR
ncbi:MAG: peptidoglycan-binding protein [Propionibacteriaceae bacterium]|nr:peptidoglycan-binding protein [Propionibacteriaceae bacterium]